MPRVLAVDDDTAVLTLVRQLLEDEGHEVRAAGSGEAALSTLDGWTPDVIVLDLRMPDLDGAAFREAQVARGLADVPVILLTGSHRLQQEAAALGVAGWLAKPFEIDDLVALVARVADSVPPPAD